MKYSSLFIPVLILGLWLACDRSTGPEQHHLLYQISGCGGELAKSFVADSCFTYQFDTDLVIDFCVTANCCPDSSRFALSHEIIHDNITITVQDTAARLCRCICNYVIHTEFYELPLEHYIVRVNVDTSHVAYEESVRRDS